MVSQSRYACGTMRVMCDHNISAPLLRHLILDQKPRDRGYDASASSGTLTQGKCARLSERVWLSPICWQ